MPHPCAKVQISGRSDVDFRSRSEMSAVRYLIDGRLAVSRSPEFCATRNSEEISAKEFHPSLIHQFAVITRMMLNIRLGFVLVRRGPSQLNATF